MIFVFTSVVTCLKIREVKSCMIRYDSCILSLSTQKTLKSWVSNIFISTLDETINNLERGEMNVL